MQMMLKFIEDSGHYYYGFTSILAIAPLTWLTGLVASEQLRVIAKVKKFKRLGLFF